MYPLQSFTQVSATIARRMDGRKASAPLQKHNAIEYTHLASVVHCTSPPLLLLYSQLLSAQAVHPANFQSPKGPHQTCPPNHFRHCILSSLSCVATGFSFSKDIFFIRPTTYRSAFHYLTCPSLSGRNDPGDDVDEGPNLYRCWDYSV